MNSEILTLLLSDPLRLAALRIAKKQNLPQWCISAGFVRNAVWDYYHGYEVLTPLNDIDLIYFDPERPKESDHQIETLLTSTLDINWSVKNQAHMHTRNSDTPYESTLDAMSYWPEVETAVGITCSYKGFELISPFPLERVMSCSITLNQRRPKHTAFRERIRSKGWLIHWPNLDIHT